MTRADKLCSRGVEAMDRVGRHSQFEARLNAEQCMQVFANVVHELVRLGEVDLAQAEAAIALLRGFRSTDAYDGVKG